MKTKVLALILAFSMVLIFCQTFAFANEGDKTAAQIMTKETYVALDGTELPYRIYIPSTYTAEKEYSFLLFLHGAGNRGNNNENQVAQNTGLLDRIINGEEVVYNGKKIDTSKEFIIVAPQCASKKQWVDTSWSVTPDPSYSTEEVPMSQYMTAVVELIARIRADYNINSDRMYAAGLSMGGFGVWDLLCRYPDLFAAAIPMGGAGDVGNAHIIAKTPVWTFHQMQDPTVSSEGTVAMVKKLIGLGAEVKFTQYFDGIHNAWTKGFAEPELLQWLYSHTNVGTKLAFVGDSITYGAGVKNRATESVAAIIDQKTDGIDVKNFGVSSTSALYTAVAPYVETDQYWQALDYAPDILVIMLGTNDIKNENWDLGKDNFVEDYLKIINSFKGVNPDVKVIVGIPPKIYKENVFGTRSPKILDEEGIPKIYEVAAKAGAAVVNYRTPSLDNEVYFPDFLHPNADGNRIMADTLLPLVLETAKTTSVLDDASDWAKDEIALCYSVGILPLELTAKYHDEITRLEFCRMVVNMLPADAVATRNATFVDCTDESVKAAYSVGVVNGISDLVFEPDRKITREEMAAMIYRAYKLIDSEASKSTQKAAPDRALVSAWAIDSVDFLAEKEILKGDEAGNINPQNPTTVEEAALFAYRAYFQANTNKK